jgi:hypothetical protein
MLPTWKTAAKYSFGNKVDKDISKIDDSPGPKYGVSEEMTTKGAVRNPQFSLASRQRDPIPFNTPGPGSYQVCSEKRNSFGSKEKCFNELVHPY